MAGLRRIGATFLAGGAALALSPSFLPTGFAQEAAGQDRPSATQTIEVPSPVVTVDAEQLYADSAWGRRVLAEVEARSRQLAAENRRIEEELSNEEQELTELRPEMEPAAFRERAEAFDEKVQSLREEQDAKTRTLTEFRETERQRFFSAVPEILREVIAARGAVAILDQRAIVLSVTDIDITAEAILRIDERVGDGTVEPGLPAEDDGGAAGAPEPPGGAPP